MQGVGGKCKGFTEQDLVFLGLDSERRNMLRSQARGCNSVFHIFFLIETHSKKYISIATQKAHTLLLKQVSPDLCFGKNHPYHMLYNLIFHILDFDQCFSGWPSINSYKINSVGYDEHLKQLNRSIHAKTGWGIVKKIPMESVFWSQNLRILDFLSLSFLHCHMKLHTDR